ncbi:oligosaccharide flippase family protein [Vibrio cholerae]|uniref:oligosaccharide flippase family protein n=1 Tax=Vibrio cholerae TaxID=666 RepID=UPI00158341AA|nr:oligosaccharide flippase family protein [Vibrio cholerae]QKU56866.1 oligosaccharide flippase family protein [Vibrio cholerae]
MIIKLFSFSFVGSAIYAITQWLILSVIGHILDIKSVGVYATALGLAVSVNLFFNFGIRQITYSSIDKSVENLTCYVVIFQVFGLFLTLAIAYVFYSELLLLIGALYLHKIIETLSEYAYGIYQRTDDHKSIAISRVVRTLVYTLVFSTLLIITRSLFIASLGMFLSNLVSLVIVDGYTLKNEKASMEIVNKVYISSGFPLAVTAVLLSLRTTSPRFFIEEYMDLTSVGVLVSYLYIINAGGMLVQSLSQVIAPKISRLFSLGNTEKIPLYIVYGYLPILLYCMVINIILVFYGDGIMQLIYGNAFVFNMEIMHAVIFYTYITYLGSYLGYCVTALRIYNKQPVIFLILLLLNIIFVYYSTSEMNSLVMVINSMSIVGVLQIIFLTYPIYKKISL